MINRNCFFSKSGSWRSAKRYSANSSRVSDNLPLTSPALTIDIKRFEKTKGWLAKKLSNEIEKLIEERNNARNNNDYEKADKIRDKLSGMNVKINDVNGKTEWEIL